MTDSVKKVSYGNLTLPLLRDELRKRGARLAGRKQELVER